MQDKDLVLPHTQDLPVTQLGATSEKQRLGFP